MWCIGVFITPLSGVPEVARDA